MGIPFTVPVGFLFTMTIGFLFTIALAIQLTISNSVSKSSQGIISAMRSRRLSGSSRPPNGKSSANSGTVLRSRGRYMVIFLHRKCTVFGGSGAETVYFGHETRAEHIIKLY